MAEERDEHQFDETEGKAGQQPTGQQGQRPGIDSETLTSDQGASTGSDPDAEKSQGQGEGFVGSQGSESGDYLQEGGTASNTTGGSGFADQGQGAQDDDSDTETGQPSRSQTSDSDTEGSSGAA